MQPIPQHPRNAAACPSAGTQPLPRQSSAPASGLGTEAGSPRSARPRRRGARGTSASPPRQVLPHRPPAPPPPPSLPPVPPPPAPPLSRGRLGRAWRRSRRLTAQDPRGGGRLPRPARAPRPHREATPPLRAPGWRPGHPQRQPLATRADRPRRQRATRRTFGTYTGPACARALAAGRRAARCHREQARQKRKLRSQTVEQISARGRTARSQARQRGSHRHRCLGTGPAGAQRPQRPPPPAPHRAALAQRPA